MGGALLLGLLAPLLTEWLETSSASSRLSYALLVPVLASVLAFRSRSSGTPAPGQPAPGAAALWALASALTLACGSLAGLFSLSLLALPLALVAFTVRLGGGVALRRFAPALGLLFLMVPPPMPVLDRITPTLVQASGHTAAGLVQAFDPGAAWAGSTLTFRGQDLIVAEACSGSGTLLMLATLAAFLVGLFHLRMLPALLLLTATVPLTLGVNGLRIASSALVIDHFGTAAGRGLAHELLGQVVVLAGVGLLVGVGLRCTRGAALGST